MQALNNMCVVAFRENRFDDALGFCEAALDAASRKGDPDVATQRANLAYIKSEAAAAAAAPVASPTPTEPQQQEPCRNRRGCFALPCQGVSQKGFSAGEGVAAKVPSLLV